MEVIERKPPPSPSWASSRTSSGAETKAEAEAKAQSRWSKDIPAKPVIEEAPSGACKESQKGPD